jgi:GNAT superfamily N-acetyltransferase
VIAHLRAAQPTDAGATGDVLWKYLSETSWIPQLYTAAETIGFCGTMIDRGWVTVAMVKDQIEGFIARDRAEIHALYLTRKVVGRGIGKLLVDDAKAQTVQLDLWTFQAATGAQRFYLRQDFVEQDRTDGAHNDENLPDIHYIWTRKAAAK